VRIGLITLAADDGHTVEFLGEGLTQFLSYRRPDAVELLAVRKEQLCRNLRLL
jgi:hypothetical protein